MFRLLKKKKKKNKELYSKKKWNLCMLLSFRRNKNVIRWNSFDYGNFENDDIRLYDISMI